MGNIDDQKLKDTKILNDFKIHAIRNGGYEKFKDEIIKKCNIHFEKYGVNLMPLKFQ